MADRVAVPNSFKHFSLANPLLNLLPSINSHGRPDQIRGEQAKAPRASEVEAGMLQMQDEENQGKRLSLLRHHPLGSNARQVR